MKVLPTLSRHFDEPSPAFGIAIFAGYAIAYLLLE